MMRVICLLLVSLFALKVNAQQYTKFNGYGFQADRIKSDSISIHPSDTIRNKAARSIAVLNGVFYIADGTKWKVVGTDTTALSNRINLKLNIADTINKWVTNVYKVDDTTIAVLKNGTTTNIVLSPQITSVNATRLVTSVYNNTGSTIAKGSVVYISGRHSSNLPTIALAEANNEANSYKTFALVQNDIATSSSGIVIQAGNISNLNLPTSSFTDGDIVYLSPSVPGGITITKPLAPNHICKIGSVTRAHPTLGSIEVKIENGWQLDELSDVQIAAVPLDSTILQFSRVDSLWHDVNPTTAMGNRFVKRTDSSAMLTPYLRKADTITLSNRINLKLNISDTATMLTPYSRGSGTSGQVGYWNATRSLTGSSGFTFTPTTSLLLNNSVTAASAIARGQNITSTLTAAANSDVLVGLDVNPTFTNGAFTGVQNHAARIQGNTVIGATTYSTMLYGEIPKLFVNGGTKLNANVLLGTSNIYFSGNNVTWEATGITNNLPEWRADATGVKFGNYSSLPLRISVNGTENARFFSTGNVAIGTTTDAGYKLDVNGTARVQGAITGTTNISITGATATPQIAGTLSYASSITGQLNGAISSQAIASLYVTNPTYSGSGGSLNSYAIYANASYFDKLNVGITYSNSNQTNIISDLSNTPLRLQGYNVLTGASGVGSGSLLLTERLSGTMLGIAATYGGGGSRLTIFNQYSDGPTSRILINMNSVNTACFFADGSLQIGNGETTIASALLSATSTTRGFLPPRMTTTQKNAISSPATGLMVYDTTLNKLCVFTGTVWETITSL